MGNRDDIKVKLVTPQQLKAGWLELRGVTPVHRNFVVLGQEGENYIVVAPEELTKR